MITIILVIVNATRNEQPTTTTNSLTVWSPFDEEKIYSQISAGFKKANPNVSVSFKYIEAKDAKDYEAKVVNAIADGSGPDIWLVRNDWIPKHVDKSFPAFSASKDEDPIAVIKNLIFNKVVDANTVDGKLYGLPLFGDTLAVIYNVDYYSRYFNEASKEQQEAISSPAKTWQALKAQVAGISRSNGATVTRSGLAFGTSENSFAPADAIGALLVQNGSTILTADQKNVALNLAIYANGQPTFPSTEALSTYTSFATPGQANYSWNTTMGDPVDAFVAGRTGAIIGYYSTLQTILEKKATFTIKVGPLPQRNTEVAERVDYGITWSHLVNKNSPNTGAAWSYLSSLLNSTNLDAYAVATGRISVGKSATSTLSGDVVELGRSGELFQAQLQTIGVIQKPEWQGIDEIFQDMIKQVVNLKATPQNSVDSAAERLKTYLPS